MGGREQGRKGEKVGREGRRGEGRKGKREGGRQEGRKQAVYAD